MPQASKKARARHPANYWTTEEVVLAVFLRSRRVKDRAILAILNGRFAPKVRQAGGLRSKMQAVRASESESGRIDLTHDKNFTRIRDVDRWIASEIEDVHARSGLLTFTEHELEVMGLEQHHLNFSSEDSLLVAGPSQVPANQATGRREDSLPAAGPSQVLDQRTGQAMTGQRQMSDFPTLNPNGTPDQSMWPVWDATLEALFPGLGPPATPGESSFTMQSGAGDERAHDPYDERQEFEEWYDPEGEEGQDENEEDGEDEDENEEDEVGEDDDDDDAEYRFQRDENDNCWYDEDQEEEDV